MFDLRFLLASLAVGPWRFCQFAICYLLSSASARSAFAVLRSAFCARPARPLYSVFCILSTLLDFASVFCYRLIRMKAKGERRDFSLILSPFSFVAYPFSFILFLTGGQRRKAVFAAWALGRLLE